MQLVHGPEILQMTPMWRMPQLREIVREPEYRSLEFFQLHTTHCFGKDIGSNLLQAAYHEPIIRTIATAIGSLHRSFVYKGNGSLATCDETHFAVRNYNKAIRQLLSINPQNSPGTNDTILIACILFYCLECLQGHYKFAVQHGTSGLKIMKQQQMMTTSHDFPRYMPQETVTLLFAILENHILEIEGEVSLADDLQPALFSSFSMPAFDASRPPSNVEELWTCFKLLYNRFIRFISVCELLEERFECSAFENMAHIQHLQEQQIQVHHDLQLWINAFDNWLEADWTQSSKDRETVLILQIWKQVISLYLSLERPPNSELLWDEHTENFARIVTFVSHLLGFPSFPNVSNPGSATRNETSSILSASSSLPVLLPKPLKAPASTFSMSLGIVTPLYLCANRCRDSHIRHRAIDLLLFCKRREGLWDAELAGRVIEHIVRIEEDAAGIQPGAHYTPADIGLSARIRSLTPQYGEGRDIKIRYHKHDENEVIEEVFTW